LLALFASLVEWLVVSSGGNPAGFIQHAFWFCPALRGFLYSLDSRLRGNDSS